MSVTWIDAPGSTLASRSEAVDFAVSGPPGSPGITQVTWIDTPSSTLPSRFEPIDFVVGGGSPVALTPAEHLAQTTWTELYSIQFTAQPFLQIATYYETGARNATIDGLLWRFRVPSVGYHSNVFVASASGLTMAINGTAWQPGSYAGVYGWVDPTLYGWDTTKPLAVVVRCKGPAWPGRKQVHGIGTFVRSGTDVVADSQIGAVWTANGSEPWDGWGPTADQAPHVRVTTMAGPSQKLYGPILTYPDPGTQQSSIQQWCLGVVRESATSGYALGSGRDASIGFTGTATELPLTLNASNYAAGERVTVPGAAGTLGLALVGALEGWGTINDGTQNAQHISMRVYQGSA